MNTKAPSFAEEAAKFSGFTTNNGQTVDPNDKSTMSTSTDKELSDDEHAAGVKIVGAKEAGKAAGKEAAKAAAPAKVELTDAEKDAAIAKASEGMDESDELTDDEKADVLATALKAKKDAAKPGNSESDRVKKAQEGRRRAEARAARAEGKLSSLEQRLAVLEAGGGKATLTGDAKPAKGADTEDKEPDAKDFEFGEVDPKFIRALARWETRQEMAKASKNRQTNQQTSEAEQAEAELTAKREAFEDAALGLFDDFQEVVIDTVGLPKSDPAAWPLSTPLRDLIFDSKQGPQIVYGLATDPKEARRINKLTVAEQQRWFFREEAKLEAGSASDEEGEEESESGAGRQERQAAPRQISKAPPPPRRNNGGSGNKQPSAATTNFADFEAMATAAPRR